MVEDVAGTDVEMVQTTNYPWEGKVAITINPKASKSFTLRLRVPNRDVSSLYTADPPANGIASIAVNGRTVKPVELNGYAEIQRTWKAGDTPNFARFNRQPPVAPPPPPDPGMPPAPPVPASIVWIREK